eukprot:CAMPEP_0197526396 /NCGR_PEP_ID=MMETSP1318-20131121/17668_1 /TAXON_ID=552666 /ORGANISM="Partenskyella glossopodia, Strain RCC365" /LENGTH=158 /DNA_ID=CAMNT_0043080543 /DNA_START=244 /DNA_END=720 /DNA_ORIENTATION=+
MTLQEAVDNLKLKDEMLEFFSKQIEQMQNQLRIKDRLIANLMKEKAAFAAGVETSSSTKQKQEQEEKTEAGCVRRRSDAIASKADVGSKTVVGTGSSSTQEATYDTTASSEIVGTIPPFDEIHSASQYEIQNHAISIPSLVADDDDGGPKEGGSTATA